MALTYGTILSGRENVLDGLRTRRKPYSYIPAGSPPRERALQLLRAALKHNTAVENGPWQALS